MKTAIQARECYIKKVRKTIKQTIHAQIKQGNCYTTFTFSEESFKLAKDHAFWLASMGYNCTIDEADMKMRVSWI